jgi:hypothetical protein
LCAIGRLRKKSVSFSVCAETFEGVGLVHGYVRVVSGARNKEGKDKIVGLDWHGAPTLLQLDSHLQFDDWRLASAGGLGIFYSSPWLHTASRTTLFRVRLPSVLALNPIPMLRLQRYSSRRRNLHHRYVK